MCILARRFDEIQLLGQSQAIIWARHRWRYLAAPNYENAWSTWGTHQVRANGKKILVTKRMVRGLTRRQAIEYHLCGRRLLQSGNFANRIPAYWPARILPFCFHRLRGRWLVRKDSIRAWGRSGRHNHLYRWLRDAHDDRPWSGQRDQGALQYN